MPPKIADKLTDAEKKKKKQENKAKANPEKAAAKKEKNDACREKRAEAGSSKTYSWAGPPRPVVDRKNLRTFPFRAGVAEAFALIPKVIIIISISSISISISISMFIIVTRKVSSAHPPV